MLPALLLFLKGEALEDVIEADDEEIADKNNDVTRVQNAWNKEKGDVQKELDKASERLEAIEKKSFENHDSITQLRKQIEIQKTIIEDAKNGIDDADEAGDISIVDESNEVGGISEAEENIQANETGEVDNRAEIDENRVADMMSGVDESNEAEEIGEVDKKNEAD